MKFVEINGRVEGTSFVSFKIKGGDNSDSIGDQVWISNDGTKMEVYEYSDKSALQDAVNLFSTSSSRTAFKGALRRLDIEL